MFRRRIGRREVQHAAQCILAAVAIATIGCARHKQNAPLAGDYPRSRVRLMEGGHLLPVPTDGPLAEALPTSMKLDNANSFAVESGDAQVSGKYRLERDSIFFDRYARGEIWLAFAGRVFGDTIERTLALATE